MMRYRLRTLMIVLALGPPIAGLGYIKWQRDAERRAFMRVLRGAEVESKARREEAEMQRADYEKNLKEFDALMRQQPQNVTGP